MEKKVIKYISYNYNLLQFVDSRRFTQNSLSNLDNNLSEGVHRIK